MTDIILPWFLQLSYLSKAVFSVRRLIMVRDQAIIGKQV